MSGEARIRYEALERERDERESILAQMRDGVVVVDAHGDLVRMNRGMAELVGASLPAESGTALGEYVRSPELDDLIRTARRESRVVEGELRLGPGEPRHLRATATPL